jgi:hypothetical protein
VGQEALPTRLRLPPPRGKETSLIKLMMPMMERFNIHLTLLSNQESTGNPLAAETILVKDAVSIESLYGMLQLL